MTIKSRLFASLESIDAPVTEQFVDEAKETVISIIEEIDAENVEEEQRSEQVEDIRRSDSALSEIEEVAVQAVDNDDRASMEAANLAMSVYMKQNGMDHDRASFESYNTDVASKELLNRVRTIRSALHKEAVSLESSNHDIRGLVKKINGVNSSYRIILKDYQQRMAKIDGDVEMSAFGIYDFLHLNNRMVSGLSAAIRQDFNALTKMLEVKNDFDKFYQDVESSAKRAYGSSANDVRHLLESIRRFDPAARLKRLEGTNFLRNGVFRVLEDYFPLPVGSSYDPWAIIYKPVIKYPKPPHDGSTAPKDEVDIAIIEANARNLESSKSSWGGSIGFIGSVTGAIGGFVAGSKVLDGTYALLTALAGLSLGGYVGNKIGRGYGATRSSPADVDEVTRNTNYRFRGSNTTVTFTGKDLANACSDAITICNILPALGKSVEDVEDINNKLVDLISNRLASRPDALEYIELASAMASAFFGKDFSSFVESREDQIARNKAVFDTICSYMESIHVVYYALIKEIIDHLCTTVAGVVATCEKAEAKLKAM